MDLTLNQKALWYAALYKDPTAPVDYVSGSIKTLKKTLQSEKENGDLLATFRQDPKDTLAYCRQALQQIANDTKLPQALRFDRTKRYVKQYLDLILKLDADWFSHSATTVHKGIPDYVPDWFVDMWADKRLDTDDRHGREKIIVNKRIMFQDASSVLYDILMHPSLSKKNIVDKLYYYIAKKPYSHSVANRWLWAWSIRLHDIDNNDEMVCRHKALLFQVLAQACGITSKLLKCHVQFRNNNPWAHVANLIRVEHKWYLVDVTNAINWLDWNMRYAITPIPEKDIDLNKQNYQWTVDKNIIIPRKYTSRNNMYYQVR